VIEFDAFDHDEMRGVEWMRSLPVAEHAAIPMAIDPGAHKFQAACKCGWRGPLRRRTSNRQKLHTLNTRLWSLAALDADLHMQEVGGRA